MSKTSFWTRVGRWFRIPTRTHDMDGDEHADYAPSDGKYADDSAAGGGTGAQGDANRDRPAKSRGVLARPMSYIERTERDYTRVVDLVESIQKHLAMQAERADAMSRALDRLAASLAHLPDASQQQLGMLRKISDEIAQDTACSKRMEQTMSHIPQMADAQRETLVSLGRQLDASRQSDDRMNVTIEGCQQAVSQLTEATGSSTKAMTDLRWDAAAREERVAALIEGQTRRLTWLAGAALAVLVIAVAVGVFIYLRP